MNSLPQKGKATPRLSPHKHITHPLSPPYKAQLQQLTWRSLHLLSLPLRLLSRHNTSPDSSPHQSSLPFPIYGSICSVDKRQLLAKFYCLHAVADGPCPTEESSNGAIGNRHRQRQWNQKQCHQT